MTWIPYMCIEYYIHVLSSYGTPLAICPNGLGIAEAAPCNYPLKPTG